MSETEHEELEEPAVTDVPEPDQDPDEAEAEAEADAEPEPEPEPEPEASAPRDDKELERAMKKVDTARTAYANKLSTILGEDFQAFVPCELCSHFVPGFRFPQVPPPEIVGRVRAAIGLPERENFRQSPYHERCETCGGLGELLTDSLVTGNEAITCPTCHAAGFVRKPDVPLPAWTPDAAVSSGTASNGEGVTYSAPPITDEEAARRMQAAIAQAQGHAVGPPAEAG